jgi:hypothetical protein
MNSIDEICLYECEHDQLFRAHTACREFFRASYWGAVGDHLKIGFKVAPNGRVWLFTKIVLPACCWEISCSLATSHFKHRNRLHTVPWRHEVLMKYPSVSPAVVLRRRIGPAGGWTNSPCGISRATVRPATRSSSQMAHKTNMIDMRSIRSPHSASAQILCLPMYPAPPGDKNAHKEIYAPRLALRPQGVSTHDIARSTPVT